VEIKVGKKAWKYWRRKSPKAGSDIKSDSGFGIENVKKT